MKTNIEKAVAAISKEIAIVRGRIHSEEWHPRYDADASDDEIKAGYEKLGVLESVRRQLENVANPVCK